MERVIAAQPIKATPRSVTTIILELLKHPNSAVVAGEGCQVNGTLVHLQSTSEKAEHLTRWKMTL